MCILLNYVYITRWYTVPTMSSWKYFIFRPCSGCCWNHCPGTFRVNTSYVFILRFSAACFYLKHLIQRENVIISTRVESTTDFTVNIIEIKRVFFNTVDNSILTYTCFIWNAWTVPRWVLYTKTKRKSTSTDIRK